MRRPVRTKCASWFDQPSRGAGEFVTMTPPAPAVAVGLAVRSPRLQRLDAVRTQPKGRRKRVIASQNFEKVTDNFGSMSRFHNLQRACTARKHTSPAGGNWAAKYANTPAPNFRAAPKSVRDSPADAASSRLTFRETRNPLTRQTDSAAPEKRAGCDRR